MSNEELPLDLDAIEKRAAAATPGPWTAFIEGRDHDSGEDFIRTSETDLYISQSTASSSGGNGRS